MPVGSRYTDQVMGFTIREGINTIKFTLGYISHDDGNRFLLSSACSLPSVRAGLVSRDSSGVGWREEWYGGSGGLSLSGWESVVGSEVA